MDVDSVRSVGILVASVALQWSHVLMDVDRMLLTGQASAQ